MTNTFIRLVLFLGAMLALAASLAACSTEPEPGTPSAVGSATPSVESTRSGPPPPAMPFLFLDAQGEFTAPQWDDRELGAEQKAADPFFNPAWRPFAACLSAGGLEVRSNPQAPFSQLDLDAVLKKVNADYPDAAANRLISQNGIDSAQGTAKTFLSCALAWLEKSPREIFELTGVPNAYYPPKASPTPG